MILEGDKIWDCVEKEIITPIDLKLLAFHVHEEAQVKRNNLDSMKDHSITHIAKKMTNKLMYDALVMGYTKVPMFIDKCSWETSFNSSPWVTQIQW